MLLECVNNMWNRFGGEPFETVLVMGHKYEGFVQAFSPSERSVDNLLFWIYMEPRGVWDWYPLKMFKPVSGVLVHH